MIRTPGDEEAQRHLKEREQWEYDRHLALTDEDLNKTIPALLTDIRLAATNFSPPEGAPNTMTLYRHAALLAVLSKQASEQAEEAAETSKANLFLQKSLLERTRKLEKLTWALIWLTVSLLFLTAALTYDAYLKYQRDQQTEHR